MRKRLARWLRWIANRLEPVAPIHVTLKIKAIDMIDVATLANDLAREIQKSESLNDLLYGEGDEWKRGQS